MITIRTNLDRTTTIAHPRNAGFGLPSGRTSSAGLSELRIKL